VSVNTKKLNWGQIIAAIIAAIATITAALIATNISTKKIAQDETIKSFNEQLNTHENKLKELNDKYSKIGDKIPELEGKIKQAEGKIPKDETISGINKQLIFHGNELEKLRVNYYPLWNEIPNLLSKAKKEIVIQNGTCEGGYKSYDKWTLHTGSGARNYPLIVRFDPIHKFPEPPRIMLSITGFDGLNELNAVNRILVTAKNVTTEGFEILVQTWANTTVHTVWVDWLAFYAPKK